VAEREASLTGAYHEHVEGCLRRRHGDPPFCVVCGQLCVERPAIREPAS
jgi:hypothetical protein